VYVMRDLLRLLGEPGLELPALPVPERVTDLLPASVTDDPGVSRRVRRAIRNLRFSRWLQRMREHFTPPSPAGAAGPTSQRYCIQTHTLSVDQTKALVERCRAEGTTVHAAICTAWLRALAEVLPKRKYRRRVSSPVNLRGRMARPVPETAGMFLATVETEIDCSPLKDFWHAARKFKEHLGRGSSDEKVFMMPLLFHTMTSSMPPEEVGEMAKALFGGPVRYDFSITNLGRLDVPDRIGKLQVEAFYNLVNSSEHERTVNVNTFAGRTTFTLICRESKMAPEEAARLLENAIRELKQACGW
jgi:NRPS condensation-like uncharacterized protein